MVEVGAGLASLCKDTCLSPIALEHDSTLIATTDACIAAVSVHVSTIIDESTTDEGG